MNDTPEMIRQQMEVTKFDLAQKMETLEQQVSETVQSTAANATAGAVQATVDTLTGAVQGAMQSVSNALNVRHHADRHPWLVFGGCVALGYLASGFLAGRWKKSETPVIVLQTADDNLKDGKPAVDQVAATAIVAACEAGREYSS